LHRFLIASFAFGQSALCASMVLANITVAAERDQRYQAVVRFLDGNTQTIEVRVPDFYRARDMIRAMFCQGRDCIVEGPWRAP
jgi:hypothetical protein